MGLFSLFLLANCMNFVIGGKNKITEESQLLKCNFFLKWAEISKDQYRILFPLTVTCWMLGNFSTKEERLCSEQD